MPLHLTRWRGLGAVLTVALAVSAALAAPVPSTKDEKSKGETAVERLRKGLDQTLANLDIDNQPLTAAIDQLREQTKVNFILDRGNLQMMGIDVDNIPIKVKLQNVKVRSALQRLLNQCNLSYAIVGESVLITTEDMAIYRQLKQRISVDLDRVPLTEALKKLSRETGTNLLVDQRAQKEAQALITLQVDDVPLETAVRLAAEMAGLKPVRLGNVVLVTSKAHAAELRSDPELAPAPWNPNMPVPPGGGVVPGLVPPGMVPQVPVPGVPEGIRTESPKPPEKSPEKPADRTARHGP